MMNAQQILDEIRPLGTDGYRRILLRHGATDPCYGVKIEDLKKVQKRIRMDYGLALDLYDTGVYDAMYLAGLIADDKQMTEADLQSWVERASAPLAGSTVAWVAAGSPHAWRLALRWIDSPVERIAAAGWATLTSYVSIMKDEDLDLVTLRNLIDRVAETIHEERNDVRYQMNSFVIGAGSFVPALKEHAVEAGERIGPVTVDMGDTACQVPLISEYIRRVEAKGRIGKKRKTAKC